MGPPPLFTFEVKIITRPREVPLSLFPVITRRRQGPEALPPSTQGKPGRQVLECPSNLISEKTVYSRFSVRFILRKELFPRGVLFYPFHCSTSHRYHYFSRFRHFSSVSCRFPHGSSPLRTALSVTKRGETGGGLDASGPFRGGFGVVR